MKNEYATRDQLTQLFGNNFAIKKITNTDVTKGYYYPVKKQKKVILSAGYRPKLETEENLIEFYSLINNEVYLSSYYTTIRKGSGREPEPRIGRELTNFYSKGEELAICSDSKNLFITKVSGKENAVSENILEKSSSKLDLNHLKKIAVLYGGIPKVYETNSYSYTRNASIKNYILRRAEGICENTDCENSGFLKDDGTLYFEHHHIVPLSEGGEDSIFNSVLLCAECHRKAHFWNNRIQLKNSLIEYVDSIESDS